RNHLGQPDRQKSTCEQRRNRNANQQGTNGTKGDGKIHQPRPPRKSREFLQHVCPLRFLRKLEFGFEHPGAVNDSPQPVCQNAKQCGYARDEEHRRDSQLDYVRNGRDLSFRWHALKPCSPVLFHLCANSFQPLRYLFSLLENSMWLSTLAPTEAVLLSKNSHTVMASLRTGVRSRRTDTDVGNTPWRTSSA